MEIVFRPDPTILDGRYANNGWLQELPKPLSKVTWDNVAYISASTAEQLGIPVDRVAGNQDSDLLEITYQGRKAQLPVWVLPGTADDVVVVHFGYGRREGRPRRHRRRPRRVRAAHVDAPWFEAARRSRRPARRYLVASTQNHFAMEGRNPVRVVDAEEYQGAIRRPSRSSGPRSRLERSRSSRRRNTTATSGACRST